MAGFYWSQVSWDVNSLQMLCIYNKKLDIHCGNTDIFQLVVSGNETKAAATTIGIFGRQVGLCSLLTALAGDLVRRTLCYINLGLGNTIWRMDICMWSGME